MKYLKRYNESSESITDEVSQDIRDILLEINDIGLYTKADYYNQYKDFEIIIEHNPSIDDYSEPFRFLDIKDCIMRLIDYMKVIGYSNFLYTDIYTEFNCGSFRNKLKGILPNDEDMIAVIRLYFTK